MTRDRKIVENQGVPEYATYADLPLPANYKGLALTQDDYILYRSDGLKWSAIHNGANISVPRLECVDQVPVYLFAASVDGLYVFGRNTDGKSLSRMDKAFSETVLQDCTALYSEDGITALGANSFPNMCFTTKNGYVFAQVIRFSDNKAFLYKSVDNGANWGNNYPAFDNKAPVSRVGYDGSTHIDAVTILGERGFTEVVEGGKTYYVYGEYNVKGSGAQDVALNVSHDFGTTWTRSIFFSSARHIHFVKQDPYHGYIWVGLGDSLSQAGIVRLDSILMSIPVGTTHAQIANKQGCKIFTGLRRYCTTDLHFEPNYIINCVDLGSGASATTQNDNAGFWKFDYDMTYYTRVCNTYSDGWDDHSLYWMQKHTSSGIIIGCELIEDGASNQSTCRFFTSADNGLSWTWNATARRPASSPPNAPGSMLEWNDSIWMVGGTFARSVTTCSMAIRPKNQKFDPELHGNRVEIGADGTEYTYGVESIIPAVWIDYTTGTDGAGYGYSPRTPFKTMTYALGSSRTGAGYIVNILGALTETVGIAINFSSPLVAPVIDPIYPTIIRGCGKNGPLWSSNIAYAVLEVRASPKTSRIDLVDINAYCSSVGPFIANATELSSSTIRVIDSKISVTNGRCASVTNGNVDIVRSELSAGTSTPIIMNAGAGKASAKDSLLATTGSVVCTQNNSGGKLTLKKCTLTGFTTYAINLSSITPADLTSLYDCLLYSSGGTAAILGNTNVTYTTDNFNNVVSNKAFTNVGGTPNVIQDAALTVTGYRTNKTIPALSGSSLDVEKKQSVSAGCYSIT